MTEPTKEEFEQRYDVEVSTKTFNTIKKVLWEICMAKNTKEFYKSITKNNVQGLIDHVEKNFN